MNTKCRNRYAAERITAHSVTFSQGSAAKVAAKALVPDGACGGSCWSCFI